MERDLGTTLETKQDLLLHRHEMRQDMQLLRQEMVSVRQEIENRYALLDQKVDTAQLRTTVQLGSMLIVGFGLAITAMRPWL